MTIFRLERNTTQYMYFTFDISDLFSKMGDYGADNFGEKLGFDWVKPKGKFNIQYDEDGSPESLVAPDISQFEGPPLILKNKEKIVLEPHLKNEGEFFEIECDGGPYWYFNPTVCIDDRVVDQDRSELVYINNPLPPFDKVCVGVKSLSFNEHANDIDAHLFLLEFNDRTYLFCTEKFKGLFESENLGGMKFSNNYVPLPCETTQEEYEEALRSSRLM